MLIAIIGTPHSGRKSVSDYLLDKGFLRLSIRGTMASTTSTSTNNTSSSLDPDDGLKLTSEFNSASEMLAHTTRYWRENFVTTSLTNIQLVGIFVKRPFFMLINVDAPILTRFRRGPGVPLEGFVSEHDALLYDTVDRCEPAQNGTVMRKPVSSLRALRKLATFHIVNDFVTKEDLYTHLDELQLLDPNCLRPDWDNYFMMLASHASMRSNCMKRRVGAILVRENRIVATGYNGTPRGLMNCNEGGCARCNGSSTAEGTCLCLHAEENALLEAGRERTGGATIYCNTCPCLTCTIKIIQAGAREVVYNLSYKVDDASATLFRDAGVLLRRHHLPHLQH